MGWRKRPSVGGVLELRVLGGDGGVAPGYQTTSFLINQSILIDAGSAASALDLEEQKKIDAIFISHSHLDHVKDICFLADNVFASRRTPIELISKPEILEILQTHLFNNKLWPDFSKISNGHCPIIRYRPVEDSVRIGPVEVSVYPVHHPVPAIGFIVRQGDSSIVITGDTGPTEILWEAANKEPNLKAVLTEIAFPNEFQKVANAAGHLTPQMFQLEMQKLKKAVPLLIYHLKPEYIKELKLEIKALEIPKLKLLEAKQTFSF
ncbi:MAG: 3',5'-cyclic-nucleotide phosphodiesterase [Proteobacteria bacterium]|nr:MAG: 3',5'-cyclic-nucleotide phosphodiesterase [Pseudomonadota bacterium]